MKARKTTLTAALLLFAVFVAQAQTPAPDGFVRINGGTFTDGTSGRA